MHELSLAEVLVEEVVKVLSEKGLTQVHEVEIEVGELRGVIPDAMRFAFDAAIESTPVAGAKLVMAEIQAAAECENCRQVFRPAPHDFQCPACGIARVRLLKGNEFILKSIVAEDPSAGKESTHENTSN